MNKHTLENLFRVFALIGIIGGGASVLAACGEDEPFEDVGDAIGDVGDEVEDEIDNAF